VPNGDSEPRSWTRLLFLLTAFKRRYDHWPSSLKLGQKIRSELRQFLGPVHYAQLVAHLSSLPDEDSPEWSPIWVSDEKGNALDYESLREPVDQRLSLAWLGIDPHWTAPYRTITPSGPAQPWDIVSTSSMVDQEELARRNALADSARAGDWSGVLGQLNEHPNWVNAVRPSGASGYTALHQAAHHGAPASVVATLLERGAWRLMSTTSDEIALDIANRKGHAHLRAALTPRPTAKVESSASQAMQEFFHSVIRIRAGHLLRRHQPRMPQLAPLQEMPMKGVWMPIPGMHGGFHFWLVRGAPDPLLTAESWSRVVDGSGQRHEVSTTGVALVAEGFVIVG
jgi:hypothetical protein